ncbi:unnamed protein product [Diabrotica balteata]|uniref:DUF4776 domain-containing protein n=1 Tax=Diabrotica balteata TaxID=107213 RepID=A0A9N9T8B1_DIABA|nr:unnamed protein product [Diabrotica balteata]
MPDHRLFLLEFLINKIEIDTDVLTPPKLEDLLVHFRCPDFLFLDITAEEFPADPLDTDFVAKDGVYKFNFGKTYLFPYTSEKLMNIIESTPLEIDLRISRKTVGSAIFPWIKDFSEMINIFETIGVVKSVNYSGIFDMISLHHKRVGEIDVIIKMSCLGTHMETYFCLLKKGGLFMGARSDIQYKCERYNFEDDVVPPVASIFNPLANGRISVQRLSWTELFGSKQTEAKQSFAPMLIEFDDAVCRAPLPFSRSAPDTMSHGSQYDIVSMVFRPPENKFFDFLNMMRAEVCATEEETIVTVAIDKPKKTNFTDEVQMHDDPYHDDAEVEATELTAEKMNKQLCKHKDCPAAKKFKKYGIGPLATGLGLGTLYDIVEPPVTYGISNTYGSFEHYGPYGVFRRPKDPDQPYYPPAQKFKTENESKVSLNTCTCKQAKCSHSKLLDREGCLRTCKHNYPFPKKDQSRTLRLRGGGMPTIEQNHSILLRTNENLIKESNALLNSFRNNRIRGGGIFNQEPVTSRCITPKSAITECKSIMDQFDQVVNAYKKALGPCGEVTCPFATNVIEDQCRDYCKQLKQPEEPKESKGKSCESIPCKQDLCPYREKPYPFGCGTSGCAYAKYKTGLREEDAALELMFLPAPLGTTCGHPKCDYPGDVLPPIHWDCPDPLPRDTCKNPNCPLQPPELQKLKCPVPNPETRGPCGSISCPYALPEPCDNPNCPFNETPCPYLGGKQTGGPNITGDQVNEGICNNPDCPSKKQQFDNFCENPNCPFKSETTDSLKNSVCSNPQCPFVFKSKKNICDNPECPLVTKDIEKDSICDNPDCPQAKKKNICENPFCPFNKQKNKKNNVCNNDEESICDNPDCPFAKKKDDICENPLCPFNRRVCKKNSIGSIPECPFAFKVTEEENLCDNPDCPYVKKKDNICENPQCPFTLKGTKKKSICDNPMCPNAKQECNICKNSDCPFNTQIVKNGSVCDNPECPFALKDTENESICYNPDCPYAKKEDNICKRSPCPFDRPISKNSSCDNPFCPFADDSETDSTCDNIDCPFTKKKSMVSICSNPSCPANKSTGDNVCENPECPFANKERGDGDNICGDPNCPYKKKQLDLYCSDPKCPRDGFQGKEANEFVAPVQTTTKVSKQAGQSATPKEKPESGTKKKAKKRGRFVYSVGDKYPGVNIGHRECVIPRRNVPSYMGWLWNKHTPILQMKPRRGWRPGAIERTIAKRIEAHRIAKGLGKLNIPNFPSRGPGRQYDGGSSSSSLHVKPKPTLKIQKKDGVYNITMNPLKDPKTLAENEDPYMECTPMQFKITKAKKDEDSNLCHCDDEPESTSDSELDIEFTPPAGIIHPERFKKKKNIINCESQYDATDFETKGNKGKGKKDGKKGKGKGKGKGKTKGGKKGKGKK